MRLEHHLVGGYVRYISPYIIIIIIKILQGALSWNKISTVRNWYFHLFEWGKITTWQEVQAISAEYERSTKIASCILKIRACFQKCTGAFWRIQEGS